MAAVPSFPLIADITSPTKDAALFSFDARTTIPTPLFVRNDGTPVALRLVTPNKSGVRAFDDFDPSTYNVALAIGEPDKYPIVGSWQLTSGVNTTSALTATITAADLQTALNLLPGVSVTVALLVAGTFAVTFTALGAQTLLTSPANSLAPTSAVIVSQVLAGSASTYEIQVVRLVMVPYALNTSWTPFASASATIDTLVAGAVATYQQDRVTLDPVPYDGSFTINGSTAIPYNASAATVQAALAVDDPDVAVTGSAGGPWTITRGVFGLYSRTANVAGLIVPVGLDGILNLNTYSMLQRFLLTTENIITVVLECQITSTVPGSKPVTVLQIPVRVSRDVIDFSSLLPAPSVDYYTADEVDALFAEINYTGTFTNTTGNTTVIPVSSVKRGLIVGTIAGTARTSTVVMSVTGRTLNDRFTLRLNIPATASIVLDVTNATSGGTSLIGGAITTTGAAGQSLLLDVYYDGSAFQPLGLIYPTL